MSMHKAPNGEAVRFECLETQKTDHNKTIINIYDQDGNPFAAIPAVEVNMAYRDGDQESGYEEIKTLPIREIHLTMKLTLWQRINVWWWFRKVKKGWKYGA